MWWDKPTYKEQLDGWFEAIDKYWTQLSFLIEHYHPRSGDQTIYDLPITAKMAEEVRREVADEIRASLDYVPAPTPVSMARHALMLRDAESLHRILNETWWGIPESSDCWSLPKFGLLCDLCSDFPNDGTE